MEQDYNNFAPRVGVAWDVSGNGKTAIRAGLGQVLPPRAADARAQHRRATRRLCRPSAVTVSSTRPSASAAARASGRRQRGREVEQKTPNNWQWNLTFQHEVFRRSTIEVGYVANYGYDMLRMRVANQVLPGDTNSNGSRRSAGVRAHVRRPPGRPPVRRLRQRQYRHLDAHRRVDVPLASNAVDHPLRPWIAVPDVVYAGAIAGEPWHDRQRPARREQRRAGQPESRCRLGPARHGADAHLQRVADLPAADARGQVEVDAGTSSAIGRSRRLSVAEVGQPITAYTGACQA